MSLSVQDRGQYPGFVYAASSSCYGLAKTPTEESHNIDPKYPMRYRSI